MKKYIYSITFILILFGMNSYSETPQTYRSPNDINRYLKKVSSEHGSTVSLHNLCTTSGKNELTLIELNKNEKNVPAVLIVANMVGDSPLASEASLKLIENLTGAWKDELNDLKWYIIPVGNPDGYLHFFEKPLVESYLNKNPFNDDKDDATDEDGPDDLNGDGFITQMRQKHPDGIFIATSENKLLMKKADFKKGELGEYRIFSEGIDNDGDGKINEDGPGGTIPGHNFPHNFEHYTATNGLFAASEVESRAILRFAFDHPEIAMVIVFGRSNSLKEVPSSSRKAEEAGGKYKLPERWATRLGIDPDEEFSMSVLLPMLRDYTGYKELTADMVLQFIGAGAAVNPDSKDVPYWQEISKRYNDFIKNAGLDKERLKPAQFPPGSVDEWAYYQFGVPCFSMDFWTAPKIEKKPEEGPAKITPLDIEKMSNDEFINLGSDKINAMLKESGISPNFDAERVISALRSGKMNTKKIAEFLKKAKKQDEAEGFDETEQALYDFDQSLFVEWTPYNHPTLGPVEIGGIKPYAEVAPPPAIGLEYVQKQLPFLKSLVKLLPKVEIIKTDIKKVGTDVWRIDVWIANTGFLPYPTHQGKRCRRPTPIAVALKGSSHTLLEGKQRKVLDLLAGSGGNEKVSWLVSSPEGSKVTIEAASASTGKAVHSLTLKGGGK